MWNSVRFLSQTSTLFVVPNNYNTYRMKYERWLVAPSYLRVEHKIFQRSSTNSVFVCACTMGRVSCVPSRRRSSIHNENVLSHFHYRFSVRSSTRPSIHSFILRAFVVPFHIVPLSNYIFAVSLVHITVCFVCSYINLFSWTKLSGIHFFSFFLLCVHSFTLSSTRSTHLKDGRGRIRFGDMVVVARWFMVLFSIAKLIMYEQRAAIKKPTTTYTKRIRYTWNDIVCK